MLNIKKNKDLLIIYLYDEKSSQKLSMLLKSMGVYQDIANFISKKTCQFLFCQKRWPVQRIKRVKRANRYSTSYNVQIKVDGQSGTSRRSARHRSGSKALTN